MIYNYLPKIGLLLSVFLLSSGAHSQDILWEKSYGGKQSDYLFDAQPTADYGFILAGSSLSGKTGNKTGENFGGLDYWIWKMDAHGDLDWQKSFGGKDMDMLQSIKTTADGGFILAGTSNSERGFSKKDACLGKEDFWIIKLDAKGNEQWQRTIGGSEQELLQSIYQTSDGGFIIGGSSASGQSEADGQTADFFGKDTDNYGSLDYWVVKLDDKGKIQWQKSFGGIYSDVLKSIEQSKDGGYILGGNSNSPVSGNKNEKNYGNGDYWVIKLDKTGEMEWQKTYGGTEDDQLYVVHQAHDGNFIAGGNATSGTTGNKTESNGKGTDFWVLKLDASGTVLWQETYDTGQADFLTSMVENDDHSLLLGGYAMSETSKKQRMDKEGINDYIAIKIDEKGDEVWKKTIGGNGEDILRKAIEIRDGGYLLAGTSRGKVSKDKNSNIGRNDFWVVKLKDKDKPKKEPEPIEAVPNPAAEYTNIIIGYEFKKGTATLYDLGGRQLQSFPIHDRTVPIDMTGLPEGIYIVQIKTNESTGSVKVIKGLNKN